MYLAGAGVMAAEQDDRLKVFFNPHLRPNCRVASGIEMLTYLRVRCVFNPRDALHLNLI
jgi:hypothetical protein